MTIPLPDWRSWRTWRALRPFQRHGRVLIVAGLIYNVIGLQYVAVPLPGDRHKALEVALWFSHGSVEFWGWVWIGVGWLAIASARWPTFSKLWGYTALSWLSALWLMQYATGLLLLGLPFSLVLGGVCAWGLITALWLFIAGLVNPDDLHPGDPRAAEG